MSGFLIIRPQGLGDIIHLIPSLKMLREKFPDEKISLLCRKSFGCIIPKEYNIDIIEMPAHASFIEMISLIKKIRQEHFDILFDLFGNPRTAIISLLSGVKERYGFDYRIRKYVYTKTYSPPNVNKHLMQLFSDFFAYFGIEGKVEYPNIKMPTEIKRAAEKSIEGVEIKHPFLGINPNSGCQSRAWPKEYIVKFINLWYEKTKAPVLLTQGPNEYEYVNSIIKEVGFEKSFTHKPVKTDEFLALLGMLDVFLTADTGPMNISWAAGTPTVALYGATTSEPTAPRGEKHLLLIADGIDCLRCHKDYCEDKKCMKALTPEYVLSKIIEKYKL